MSDESVVMLDDESVADLLDLIATDDNLDIVSFFRSAGGTIESFELFLE